MAVGYQWSFSPAVQALKDDIRSGLFGAARKLKCLYLWPRDEGYYARNDWAGKRKDAEGAWVLDSPVQNAMAHDLHNMFYVLGKTRETSARPAEVEAELYRANAIENFDTAAARIRTEEGVEILFFVSHASEKIAVPSRAMSSIRPSSAATAGPRASGPNSPTGVARITACRTPNP